MAEDYYYKVLKTTQTEQLKQIKEKLKGYVGYYEAYKCYDDANKNKDYIKYIDEILLTRLMNRKG